MADAERIKLMGLSFDEFLNALLATTGLKLANEQKKTTVPARLEQLIEDLLNGCEADKRF